VACRRWLRRRGLKLAGPFLALAVLALTHPAVGQQQWVEAAKGEGRVTVYGGIQPDVMEVIAKIFQGRYGIRVDYWRASASAVADRVVSETRVGRPLFDVVEATTDTMELMKAAGAFQRFRPEGAEALFTGRGWRDPFMSPPYRILITALLYNTRLVPAAELPRSYLELLDPKWRGRLVMPDPRRNVGVVLWLYQMREVLGRDYRRFLEGLAQQNPAFVESFAPVPFRVISGEFPMGIGFLHYVPLYRSQGAPVGYVPVSPMLAQGTHVALGAHAAHPNAGRLFIETLLSRAALLAIAQAGEFVTLPGVRPPLEGVERLQIRVIPVLGEERIREFRRELESVFGRR